MNDCPPIVITGTGEAGSWNVRAKQLGSAVGAAVCDFSRLDQALDRAEIVTFVKHVNRDAWAKARDAGKFLVWDLIDFHVEKIHHLPDAISFIGGRIGELNPDLVLFQNKQMQEDIRPACRSSVIYDHSRPGIERNPIRREVETVGYDGMSHFIAEWEDEIAAQCAKPGWKFIQAHIMELAAVDIVIAVRGGARGSAVARRWKSNIKLANAQASGTPIVCGRECAYMETDRGGVLYCEDPPGDLGACFDALSSWESRQKAHEALLAAAPEFTLEKIAACYARELAAAYWSARMSPKAA